MSLATTAVSLAEFLKQPETTPASEYINGRVWQKPMPKTRLSLLKSKLVQAINGVIEGNRLGYAFPELRCSFGDRSIVLDVVVLRWDNIAFNEFGEPLDDVQVPPDWVIEILSPDQSANRVTGNILYALENGCELGWLIDPDDRSVLVLRSQQSPVLFYGETALPLLSDLPGIELTAEQIFGWLRMQP
ncbi:MAG: Uma2 family endonuclease [Cyanobacteria bacterium P01_F01_bin.153]